MKKNSLFIVIDGLDGSGKGAMIKSLQNYFSHEEGFNIITTFEPTHSKFGKEARNILESDNDPLANAEKCLELFTKDREEHLKHLILPFLEAADEQNTRVVLCDRYYYSTIVFQHVQGIDINLLLEKNKDFLKPDVAFILDLPVDIALERMKERGKPTEKFESGEFMKQLRDNFLNLKKNLPDDNIITIDASGSKKEVFEQIKAEVNKLLED